ncbi:photosystem I assembly protein Ycf4 [Phormidium sp. CCY1219]|uniref:photosystem I assembly protein Ycf4 n=1 Tax=Phormidium sp. CCY1219 TaxID=2886104 RepID=UPI002D1EDF8B|nr:photosystem I assembly protein Ycf4 [Phormidium sp. CCY1219]MEB3827669.1 photosystem I assembly protein Ycf4 [Phormidium sp. CCY1219]
MTAKTTISSDRVLYKPIVGSRRITNYLVASVVTLGATGFLLASLSSYYKVNFLPFSDPTQLVFIPQGLVMGFYGVAGLLLALYLWMTILLNVGGGYNEFNKDKNEVRIFRWGFPGKNRKIDINYPLDDVQSIRVDVKEGLNPKRVLYLRVKGHNPIPLSRVGQPIPLAELENEGAELARFLGVPLDGF